MPMGSEIMDVALKGAIPAYKASLSRLALKAIADNMLATKQLETAFDTAKMPYEKAP